MKKIFLSIVVITLVFTSCKKDKCKDVLCASNQTCIEGDCVDINGGDGIIKSGFITSNETWTADNIYILEGRVIVNDGITLSIEPGTIIKGNSGTGTNASALIVARGGMLMAEGTASKPIIFTSVLDNIAKGQLTGTNLDENDREKWGGVIILGNAPVSTKDGDTQGQIEGIPATETYGIYGGSDVSDNSGVLKYISIRHGGTSIGDGNEINGLTLAGVGAATQISHIEVVANLDDGIEWFGGTVNTSDILIYNQGDDALDIDQNYAGTISEALIIHGGDTDNGIEWDGPENSTHTSGLCTIENSTFRSSDAEGRAATIKSKGQGNLHNCVFENYNNGIRIRASFENECADSKTDSYTFYTASTPSLIITSNALINVGSPLLNIYTESENAAMEVCTVPSVDITAAQNLFDSENGGSATGATASFAGWTWADANGKL